ncbi:MAG: ABC transporter ATP-binding protein [Acidobacteriota bacterium]|nr:ABC transporter ATP-binding protein [Acidobacteriota bacterium]
MTRPSPSFDLALKCVDLVKRYGDLVAVDHLQLTVKRGECFGLLGPNGAGKTTTIEILEGLLAPDAGHVEVLGRRWGHDDDALRQRLGVHLQETQFDERLTVVETLRLFRSFYTTGQDITTVLDTLGLQSKTNTWVVKLSGGQKQRLAVGCALVGSPELLFLDEPTTGLDPQSRRQLWSVLKTFRETKGTILLTTHYMDEAEVLCDRVAIVDRGQVIALGTPKELIASLGAAQVIEFGVGGPDAAMRDALELKDTLERLPGVRTARRDGGLWQLSTTDLQLGLPALMRFAEAEQMAIDSVATHTATLEDVFVALTGKHLRDD